MCACLHDALCRCAATAVMSYHTSTHPSSSFAGVVFASRPTPSGSIVLRGMALKQGAGTPGAVTRDLESEDERAAVLRDLFGLSFEQL